MDCDTVAMLSRRQFWLVLRVVALVKRRAEYRFRQNNKLPKRLVIQCTVITFENKQVDRR